MIFLFRDNSYKVMHPLMEEGKIIKKFKKWHHNIKAVMMENETRLHTDTFCIIERDNFQTDIHPFQLTYVVAYINDEDQPIDDANSMKRSIHITTIREFYQAAALLYQLAYSESVGDYYSIGPNRAILVSIKIHFDEDKDAYLWNMATSKETAVEFVRNQGMILDTDRFLDASMGNSKADMVEDGCYITRKDISGDMHLNFYHHAKKHLIWFRNGKWFLFGDNIVPRVNSFKERVVDDVTGIYAICLNNTGLVYMASYPFLMNLTETTEAMVDMHLGTRETITDVESGLKYTQVKTNGNTQSYVAYNVADVLYMALYLPQLWDMARFFYGDEPVLIEAEFILGKSFHKTGNYKIPASAYGQGLHIDLFSIMAKVFSFQARSISFNES